jgi:DNA-binding NtrC family response regulator
MPMMTQVKLLRAIETKEFMSIGSETVTKVDVRFIIATNKDLQKEVDEKRFREDLYFRLKAVTLNIPPLRKRKEDIEVLTHYFIEKYADENKIKKPAITDEALNILMQNNWPGNVRELKNTLETAIALNKGGILDASSFSAILVKENVYEEGRNLPIFLRKSPEEADRELLYRALFEIKKDLIDLKDLIIHQQKEIVTNTKVGNEEDVFALDEMEKEAIKNALEKTRGSKRKAAKLLNISERTLYRKIKQYELQ